jgi:hypothetical protein
MINKKNRYTNKESNLHTLITKQKYLTTILNSKDTAVLNYLYGYTDKELIWHTHQLQNGDSPGMAIPE